MKLTKLFTGLCTAVLTAALALAVSAADPIVAWDFADSGDTTLYNEDGTPAFSVNQATAVYDAENACITADVTGGDPFFNLPNRGHFPAENSFIRVKYYLSGITDWSTSVYFTTDTVSWSETGHWKGFYDGDDDEWFEQTFIMTECEAWAGTITDVRLDIFDNAYEGQLAKVAYVAVFATEEDANSFDYAAWQANGRPTTLAPAADETIAEEAPVEEAPVEEAPAEEAPTPEEEPVEEIIVEEPVTVEAKTAAEPTEAEAEETVEEAAQTFDMGIIAAVSAIVSLAGYAVSKKR